MSLANASGYPIKVTKNHALFHPGNLHSGQTRTLFLTFKMAPHNQKTFEINGITARYIHKGQPYSALLSECFEIACVKNQREVISSIDKEEWEKQVTQEDYNKLKDEVSMDIKDGKEKKALDRIQTYYRKKQQVNTVVGSGKVAENLDKDLNELRHVVKDTFTGSSEAIRQKQKANAKALQYEGYKGRRTN